MKLVQGQIALALCLLCTACASLKSDGDSPWALGWPTPNGPVGVAAGTNAMTECVQVAKAYESCLRQFASAMCDKNYQKARDECKSGTVVPGTMPSLGAEAFQDKGTKKTADETKDDESTKSKPTARDRPEARVANQGPVAAAGQSGDVRRATRQATPQELNAYAAISCAGSLVSRSQRIVCSNRQLLEDDYYITSFFDSQSKVAPDASRRKLVTQAQLNYNSAISACNDRDCILNAMVRVANWFKFEIPHRTF